jgi:ribosomal protein L37AE/L43A
MAKLKIDVDIRCEECDRNMRLRAPEEPVWVCDSCGKKVRVSMKAELK